jgi:hypothetical protein
MVVVGARRRWWPARPYSGCCDATHSLTPPSHHRTPPSLNRHQIVKKELSLEEKKKFLKFFTGSDR